MLLDHRYEAHGFGLAQLSVLVGVVRGLEALGEQLDVAVLQVIKDLYIGDEFVDARESAEDLLQRIGVHEPVRGVQKTIVYI